MQTTEKIEIKKEKDILDKVLTLINGNTNI